MATINWTDFERIELRVGTIIRADPFLEARKLAYKLTVDLGPDIGEKRSSAQITELYQPEQLIGKQVICVTNFPTKQIGPFVSKILVTGFVEGTKVTLAVPDQPVPNGTRLA